MRCSFGTRSEVGIYAEEDKGSLHVQRVTEALKVWNTGPLRDFQQLLVVVTCGTSTGSVLRYVGHTVTR